MQKSLLYHKKKQRNIIRRVAVPLAAVFCCGMGSTDALSAPCGPGRLLPVNTWLMTAPSCEPASPTDFVNQYGDDLSGGTYGTDWISFKWDTAAQNYVEQPGTDSPVLGTGNWLYSYNAGTLFLNGTATVTEPCSNYGSTDLVGKCLPIDLFSSASDSWQMVGNPFPYTVDWRNVRIASSSDGGTSWTQYTPSAAEAANLMANDFWQWNGSSYQTKDDVTLGAIGTLKPQESVWVQIKSGSNGLPIGHFLLLIPMRELNDTGITWSGNYASGNNSTCVSSSTPDGDNVVAAQDCSNGPDDADMTGNIDTDGLAGFSFTKLDSNGDPLPQDAASWACVQDNVTGLIWEVKTTSGLHNKDDRYNWYNTDPATNGGADGTENSVTSCYNYASGTPATYCNTEAYMNRVNTATLCGANDWRMPTVKELESLVNFGLTTNPTIDTDYFPNTVSSYVWSGSPYAGDSDIAWYVYFGNGNSYAFNRVNLYAVRLVRGGQ